jgi:hypothetical protein
MAIEASALTLTEVHTVLGLHTLAVVLTVVLTAGITKEGSLATPLISVVKRVVASRLG